MMELIPRMFRKNFINSRRGDSERKKKWRKFSAFPSFINFYVSWPCHSFSELLSLCRSSRLFSRRRAGEIFFKKNVFFAFSTERTQQEIDILHSLQSLMHIPLPAEEGNDQ